MLHMVTVYKLRHQLRLGEKLDDDIYMSENGSTDILWLLLELRILSYCCLSASIDHKSPRQSNDDNQHLWGNEKEKFRQSH